MVRVDVVKRFIVPGSIDGHDAVGATFRITGGDRPFRLTVVTVNWGRGYRPGEFRRNVLRLLDRVDELQYVVLLVQELDEDDKAAEHRVFRAEMMPGTTMAGWGTREPIAISPSIPVLSRGKDKLMGSGLEIGAPAGTGPVRWLVSCTIRIHGVKIGLANQHPHRDLDNEKVQAARRAGEEITAEVIAELLDDGCDVVIDGGDFNNTRPPKAHRRQKVAHRRGFDRVRYVLAS